MKSRKSLIINIITIVQVVIVLGIAASYAWFSDNNNPSIKESNMRVSAAQGLVIKLTPDSEARTTINLNELLNDWNNFALEQMSSVDGVNFYTIDFGAGLSANLPRYVKINADSTTNTINMEKHGCIDYNFYFSTEDFAKHVYFHKDSFIKGSAESAIRVAVTFTQAGVSKTIIFGVTKEDGSIAYPYETNAVKAEGEFDFIDTSNELTDNQNVYLFEDYNGGRGDSDSNSIDLNKVLFTMDSNATAKVNVKIWLEGGDVDCDNELADSLVDILLKFGSANVLRDAPNVSANNAQKTITNLSVDMEYSYTSDEDGKWISVDNASMTFKSGDTVYVRYKEIQGVSPYSYVTEVTFNG